jgi:uncharacterized protein with HEPN domain
MSSRPAGLLIEDMWEAVRRVERYTEGLSLEDFLSDEKTVDAVVRNLQVIGEAASRLPEEVRLRASQIDWHKVVGLRHRVVHEYFGVDLQLVWQVLLSHLPILKTVLETLRSTAPSA